MKLSIGDEIMNEHFFDRSILLENKRVKLVPFTEVYQEGLEEIIYDQEITQFSGHHFKSFDDLFKYIHNKIEQRSLHKEYPFIVIDKTNNQVAGATSYANILFGNKRLEIGWTWYGKQFRGTGINKACKFELLKYAFEVMDFRRVQFSVDVENIRSQKAVLKLGATQEGIFRHNYIDEKSGRSRDDIYYSIIQSEWEEIKETIFNEFLDN
jgi:RimJ/RimL family protein N-acetyltransferase